MDNKQNKQNTNTAHTSTNNKTTFNNFLDRPPPLKPKQTQRKTPHNIKNGRNIWISHNFTYDDSDDERSTITYKLFFIIFFILCFSSRSLSLSSEWQFLEIVGLNYAQYNEAFKLQTKELKKYYVELEEKEEAATHATFDQS